MLAVELRGVLRWCPNRIANPRYSRLTVGATAQVSHVKPLLATVLGQVLVHFSLIKEAFIRHERARIDDANLFSVRPINTENANAAGRHSQVEKPGLDGEPRRIRQHAQCERVFKRFFDFPQGQRAIKIEGRIIPIKLHTSLIVNETPMQCIYIVFTSGDSICQHILRIKRRKKAKTTTATQKAPASYSEDSIINHWKSTKGLSMRCSPLRRNIKPQSPTTAPSPRACGIQALEPLSSLGFGASNPYRPCRRIRRLCS